MDRKVQTDRQTDRQYLFILHSQRKDPEVIKVSWPWVSHYAYSAVTAAIHKGQTQLLDEEKKKNPTIKRNPFRIAITLAAILIKSCLCQQLPQITQSRVEWPCRGLQPNWPLVLSHRPLSRSTRTLMQQHTAALTIKVIVSAIYACVPC